MLSSLAGAVVARRRHARRACRPAAATTSPGCSACPTTPPARPRLLLDGDVRRVDLLSVDRPAATPRVVAGSVYAGVDARAAAIVDRAHWLPRTLQYPYAAVRSLATYQPGRYRRLRRRRRARVRRRHRRRRELGVLRQGHADRARRLRRRRAARRRRDRGRLPARPDARAAQGVRRRARRRCPRSPCSPASGSSCRGRARSPIPVGGDGEPLGRCCPASTDEPGRASRSSRARSPSSADVSSVNDHTSSSVGLAAVTDEPGLVGDPERVAGRERLGQAGARQRPGGDEDVLERLVGQGRRCRRRASRATRNVARGTDRTPRRTVEPPGPSQVAPARVGRTPAACRSRRASARPARTGSAPTGSGDLGVHHARAGRQHLHRAGHDHAGVPVVVGVRAAPRQHPGDDLEVAVRVVGEAGAGREQVVVVADQRPEADVLGVVVGAERERVPGDPSLTPRVRKRSVPRRISTLTASLCTCDPRSTSSPPAPPGLPLRDQHRVVPDRGRGDRGRQGPQHLGHLHRAARADQGRVERRGRLRPLPPVAGGRRADEASSARAATGSRSPGRGSSRPAPARPTQTGLASTTG